ncbi:hypothetical protein Dimus_033531, partial [Dionaea muscipula]
MKKVNLAKTVGCDVAEKLSRLRPRRCVDLGPRCAAELDLGLPLSPIEEEVGLTVGVNQSMEMTIMEGMGFNVGVVQKPEMSLSAGELQSLDGIARSMEEPGQVSSAFPESSVQGSSLSHVPVAVPQGLSAEVLGGQCVQLQRSDAQDGDLKNGIPLLAGAGMGKIQTETVHGVPGVPLAQGASEGSGDRR